MHSANLDCNFPTDYTYHRDDNLAQSWPDHILTYPHHSMLVTNVSTLSSVDNFSDHLPLSFFSLISHSPLTFPQSLSLLRVLRRIPRLHLLPGPRLLLARAIISVLLVTCLRYQVSYSLVVLLTVFHMLTCWISYALVFWPPYNKPQLNVCPMLGRERLVFQTGMSLPTS